MQAFRCDRCPLVFEVGGYHSWDSSVRHEQVVCTACGTMHRLEEENGNCSVFALPGPLRAFGVIKHVDPDGVEQDVEVLPCSHEDWQEVGRTDSAAAFTNLTCSRCGAVGKLVSLETPRDTFGNWPVFGEHCPLCGGPLPCVWDITIN